MAIELIRSIYSTETMIPKDEIYYKNALKEIENDGISSQIYSLLIKHHLLNQTPLFFQERLKENYTKILYQNLFIKNQTGQILAKLEEQGIEVIPLKGVLFAEKYFGHFAARPTSDIDLLIRKRDVESAVICIKELGFIGEEEQIPGHFHISFGKELPYSEIPLVCELHWDIVKENTSEFNINELWKKAQPFRDSCSIKELSLYHTFYMICLHGWRHNLDSLKYFLDIIQLIHELKDRLDYEKLLKDAAGHKVLKRMVRTLTIVYRLFPHLDRIAPFPYKRGAFFWEYQSKKSIRQYLDFIDYQFFSYDLKKHSLIEMLHWHFPKHS